MSSTGDILDAIPTPAVVRDRLSQGLRAVRLLRAQLRIAEQAEDARRRRQECARRPAEEARRIAEAMG